MKSGASGFTAREDSKEQGTHSLLKSAFPGPTPFGLLRSGVRSRDLLEALGYGPSQRPSFSRPILHNGRPVYILTNNGLGHLFPHMLAALVNFFICKFFISI